MSTRAIEAGRAVVRASLDDAQLARGLKRAQAKLKRFGVSVQALGTRLAKFGLLLAAPFAVSAKIFADFSDQMSTVQAVMGATTDQMKRMTEVAKELGATTSFTAKQAAEGMVSLARAGFKAMEVIGAIPAVLDLARATGTELGEAAEITGNSLRAFALDAGEAGRVADVLTAAANNSSQTLLDLGEALSKVAPIASKAGLTIEQTAAAIGILANVGIKGSLAGNAIKIALQNIAKTKTQDMLKALNVEFQDANKNMLPLSKIMSVLATKTKEFGNLQVLNVFQQLFGRASVAATALTGAGEKLTDLTKLLEMADGTARRTAVTMDKNLGGAFRILLSATEGVAIAIGDAMNKELIELIKMLTRAAGGVRDFVKENKEFVITIAKVAGGLILVGGALAGVGIALRVAGVVAGMTTKLIALNAALKGIAFTNLVGGLTGIGPAATTAGATLLRLAASAGPLLLLAGTIALVTNAVMKWFRFQEDSKALEETTRNIERQNDALERSKKALKELAAARRLATGKTDEQLAQQDVEERIKLLAKQGKAEKEILKLLESQRKAKERLNVKAFRELGEFRTIGQAKLFDFVEIKAGMKERETEIAAINEVIKKGISDIINAANVGEKAAKEASEKQLEELQKSIAKQKKALEKFEQFRTNLAKERGERAAEEEFELRLGEVPVQALAEASQAYADALKEAGNRVKEAQDAIRKAATAPDDITKAQAEAAFDAAREAERQVDRQAQMLQAAGAAVAAVRDDAVRDLESFAARLTARAEDKTRETEQKAFGELLKIQPGKALAVVSAELADAEKDSVREIVEAQTALKLARESGKKADLERAQAETGQAEDAIRAVDRLENFVRQAGDEVARRLAGARRAIGTATFSGLAAARVAGGIADPIQKAQLGELGKIVKNGGDLLRRFDELGSLGTLG